MNTAQFLFAPEGHIFLCEIDGRLHSMPAEHASLSTFTNSLVHHPNVSVTRETLHFHAPVASRESTQQLFLPTRETLSKRVISTWYQHGLRPALELISEEGGGSIGKILRITFSVLDKLLKPKSPTLSHISSVFSPIRLIAWHPHLLALAVVAWDDSIRLFSSQASLCCILKTRMQKSVNCLAWRPYTACQLAVGCEGGVVIWNRDPNNKTSMVCVTFLPHPNKAPVTSLTWNPQGDVLLTASCSHGDMHAWNVDAETFVTLPRRSRNGTGLLLWSPSNLHLLSATVGVAFHVWNRQDWSSERWAVTRGRVVAACFSPCGSVLLFTSSEEPLVFAISLRKSACAISGGSEDVSCGQAAAQLVLDHTLSETDPGPSYGGLIKTMIWDPRGRYLAIVSHQSDGVTVFTTQIGSTVSVSPCCVINGNAGEKPSHISFQPYFEDGSQLTIAWSSGRVQYFPFIYQDNVSKPTPLQDVAPLLQMISSPKAPAATPVHPQSSPTIFSQALTSPVLQPQSPYSPLQTTYGSPLSYSPTAAQSTYSPIQTPYSPPAAQSPYSPSPAQSPYSSTPIQSSYSAPAMQSPFSTSALQSLYSPSGMQSPYSPQNVPQSPAPHQLSFYSTSPQVQSTTPQHSYSLPGNTSVVQASLQSPTSQQW